MSTIAMIEMGPTLTQRGGVPGAQWEDPDSLDGDDDGWDDDSDDPGADAEGGGGGGLGFGFGAPPQRAQTPLLSSEKAARARLAARLPPPCAPRSRGSYDDNFVVVDVGVARRVSSPRSPRRYAPRVISIQARLRRRCAPLERPFRRSGEGARSLRAAPSLPRRGSSNAGHYMTFHCITLHYITLHCRRGSSGSRWTLRDIPLRCIVVHDMTLHCITLQARLQRLVPERDSPLLTHLPALVGGAAISLSSSRARESSYASSSRVEASDPYGRAPRRSCRDRLRRGDPRRDITFYYSS